jgi:hypothetical protein
MAREHGDDVERAPAPWVGDVAARSSPGRPSPVGTVDAVGLGAGAAGRRAGGRLEVDGRLVVDDGRLMTADLDEIRAEARDEAERLWARMRAL